MEYGLIPKIDQYSNNKFIELQKISATNIISKTDEQSKLIEVVQEEYLNTNSELKVNKTTTEASKSYHEVVLTNTNFGFNDSSKDFFVRAVRGDSLNQYPTEQMMRIKSFLINS
jgi:hypothetical protein